MLWMRCLSCRMGRNPPTDLIGIVTGLQQTTYYITIMLQESPVLSFLPIPTRKLVKC